MGVVVEKGEAPSNSLRKVLSPQRVCPPQILAPKSHQAEEESDQEKREPNHLLRRDGQPGWEPQQLSHFVVVKGFFDHQFPGQGLELIPMFLEDGPDRLQ